MLAGSMITRDTVALAARGVTKLYGRSIRALDDITLELPTGAVTALVGPNGAGKTTLMRMWLGFERPTRGHVEIRGGDASHRTAKSRPIGYVPQRPALYPGLSVADHLVLAKHLRPSFDLAIARARTVELGLLGDQRAGKLSGGQQSQLALVLALGLGAEILLLDEPLASLDPLARRHFLAVLLATARQLGATTVLSSHIVSEVVDVCDDLVVLRAGRVAFQGTVTGALDDHHVVKAVDASDIRDVIVGRFPELGGAISVLVRGSATTDSSKSRPATVEEIVLGYLAGQSGADPVATP